jgi:hypothetical protein
MMAGVLAAGVTVAACGSGSSTPGAATDSTTTTTGSPPAGGGTQASEGGLLAYSTCMRSHGVPNFPDPASTGGIPKGGVISSEAAVSKSTVQAATNACKHLIPATESLGGKQIQTITATQQQDYLKAAACMRSHGITNFPTPVFTGGHVQFPKLEHLVTLSSTQFKQALKICQKLIPPGLPDSGSGG